MTRFERLGWFFAGLLFVLASGCGLLTSKAADSGALPGAQSPATKALAASADEAVWSWLHSLLFGGTVIGAAAAGHEVGKRRQRQQHEQIANAATVGAARVVRQPAAVVVPRAAPPPAAAPSAD